MRSRAPRSTRNFWMTEVSNIGVALSHLKQGPPATLVRNCVAPSGLVSCSEP